jgi:uncharacterized membrane protein YdjX (TVP38/TMEM64 family)
MPQFSEETMEATTAKPARPWLKPALLAAAITALIVLAKVFDAQGALKGVLAWISGLGPLGPVIFVGIYVVATVLFLPGSVLTLGAGVVFGVIEGSIVVSIAATLGATCAFLVDKFRAVDEAVAREGWKIVGLTRLSPIFPFNLLNYAYGVTRVSLRDYFFASWIGMIPGTVMYVYIGSLAGDLAMIGTGHRARTRAEWALYVVGLLATVAVTVYVTRIARRALGKRI